MIGPVFSAFDSIEPALKNHLWQSTAFAGIAAVVTVVLRKNPARIRYWVWLTASLKFLIPFSVLVSLGSSLPRPVHTALPQSQLFGVVGQIAQPFADKQTVQLPDSGAVLPSLPMTPPTHTAQGHPVLMAISLIWLSGFLAVLLLWGLYWYRVARHIRQGSVLGSGREIEAVRRLEGTLGARNCIRLVLCDSAFGPGVYGIVKPVLIWPASISERLDDTSLESVLAHELCHVRRNDNLTALIHMLVEAIFWFHPLVWWMGTRLEQERERACDEEALRLCDRREAYAESILTVCEFCLESDLPCVSGITGADLKNRIQHIMSGGITAKLGVRGKLLLLVMTLATLLTPVLAGAVTGPGKSVAKMAAIISPHIASALNSEEHAMLARSQPKPENTFETAAAVNTPVSRIEDIAGTWQGTLHTPFQGGLRTVLKIQKASGDGWNAVEYSLDQGSMPMPVEGMTIERGVLKYSIPSVNGRFEGKLEEDGNKIVGVWTQGSSLPFTFERASKSAAWQIPTRTPLTPMPENADPSFKAAIIVPSDPGQGGRYFHTGRSAVTTHATSLSTLIQFAYGIQAKQVEGPPWITEDLYDITAVPDTEGQPSESQEKVMLQKLLASRFKLAIHHTIKQVPVFVLTVARDGTKNFAVNHSGDQLPSLFFRPKADEIELPARNATIGDFAATMQQAILDRPLIDQTGLVGRFNFTLTWKPSGMRIGNNGAELSASDASFESLTTALDQQLGLKLSEGELPLDVIVIDHADKPSN